ncbi:MAG: SAM-dependent methyltransferase [Bacteroidales bacterium]|nr:SAM-dependent methyltransferase [Bacteroidales bacterium]
MTDLKMKIIGYVHNEWEHAGPGDADMIKESISTIEVREEYADALFRIEKYSELNIIFYFDRSEGYELRTVTRSGEVRGVFACCTPRRPSMIGLTTVKLLGVEGNILTVTGLDALNNTPVLDIKPVAGQR